MQLDVAGLLPQRSKLCGLGAQTPTGFLFTAVVVSLSCFIFGTVEVRFRGHIGSPKTSQVTTVDKL
jgi:hypothetical protein